MRVLVTGASGYLGIHVVDALREAGHEVLCFVRNKEKLLRGLEAIGIATSDVEMVVGDITNRTAVDAAIDGCDAVVHTAAMVSTNAKEADQVMSTNVGGATNVFEAAVANSLDPIIHTSSITAVFPPSGKLLTSDDAVTEPQSAYAKSKAEIERLARRMQADGDPVTIFYPGGIIGPVDPTVGSNAQAMIGFFDKGFFPLPKRGGAGFIDVRELASAIAVACEPGNGARRFMAGGIYVTWPQYINLYRQIAKRDFKTPTVPVPLLKGIGKVLEMTANAFGKTPMITAESVYFMTEAVPSDDSAIHEELGVEYRPLKETLTDFVQWLVDAGHVEPKNVPGLTKRKNP
jgi:nucleoside-diphosphate-sugar epimerase